MVGMEKTVGRYPFVSSIYVGRQAWLFTYLPIPLQTNLKGVNERFVGMSVLGIASENNADQFLKMIALKKTFLIFREILVKRGYINLDLNIDLRRAKFQGILMF